MPEGERSIVRMSARVGGRVQGVSFRAYTLQRARELGISGWVKNTPDGDVMVVAEGVHSDLLELESFLHQGSPSARVMEVNVAWEAATGEFETFRIRYL